MRYPMNRYFFDPPNRGVAPYPTSSYLPLRPSSSVQARSNTERNAFTENGPRASSERRGVEGPMRIPPWYLAALAPFAALGYSGAYLGHAAVVVLTIGIFLGTLSLGRAPTSPPGDPPKAGIS